MLVISIVVLDIMASKLIIYNIVILLGNTL
jgi:hypothetical protein